MTSYPVELIETMLRAEGPTYLIDEIKREEEPEYGELNIEFGVFAYVSPQELGESILDFGCGAGASTCLLAGRVPRSNFLGIDLRENRLEVARMRAQHRGLSNVEFRVAERADTVAGVGRFHSIILNAVFEHLLPNERRTLLPELWSQLEPGGTLFLYETPYRWFPVETHTTGLPLLNYLPESLALRFARRSERVPSDDSWERLLRNGVRGGSTRELIRLLPDAQVLRPKSEYGKDPIDLWYERAVRPSRFRRLSERLRFSSTPQGSFAGSPRA